MKMVAVLNYPENIECCGKIKQGTTRTRNEKVRDIRRKIKSGKYDINKKLDIVIDRLIEEILK